MVVSIRKASGLLSAHPTGQAFLQGLNSEKEGELRHRERKATVWVVLVLQCFLNFVKMLIRKYFYKRLSNSQKYALVKIRRFNYNLIIYAMPRHFNGKKIAKVSHCCVTVN